MQLGLDKWATITFTHKNWYGIKQKDQTNQI